MPFDLDQLRKRFSEFLPSEVNHPRRSEFTPSAILVPMQIQNDELNILFTKRTQSVKHHKGQISFPGGRLEDGESLAQCALRETEEEIGLPANQVELWGQLDETLVITYYRITPFVGLIPYPFEFTLQSTETERLIIVPVSKLLDSKAHSMAVKDFLGRDYAIHFYDVGDEVIWGATGRILTQFLKIGFDYTPPLYRQFLEERKRKEAGVLIG